MVSSSLNPKTVFAIAKINFLPPVLLVSEFCQNPADRTSKVVSVEEALATLTKKWQELYDDIYNSPSGDSGRDIEEELEYHLPEGEWEEEVLAESISTDEIDEGWNLRLRLVFEDIIYEVLQREPEVDYPAMYYSNRLAYDDLHVAANLKDEQAVMLAEALNQVEQEYGENGMDLFKAGELDITAYFENDATE